VDFGAARFGTLAAARKHVTEHVERRTRGRRRPPRAVFGG
jgi:hypothetical protein